MGRIQIESGSLWSIQLDSVQVPTHWDVRREKAIAKTLLTEEEAEAAIGAFEGRMRLKDRLHSLTPFQVGEAGGNVEPSEEDAKALSKLQKDVLGGRFYNGDYSDKPQTFSDSRKLQLSAPEGFYELLNLWACAEGRDVSSVAAVAMEAGLRSLMADGAIPKVALEIYEKRSRERVARAEARTAIADFINDAEGGGF